MKFSKLFMVALTLVAFTFTSCGDDDDSTCMQCKLAVPLFDDCEIEVCEDGTATTLSGGTACLGGETAISLLSTQAEKVAALEAAGFTCN